MSSHEDENDASKKASTQHYHDASETDTVSLFGVGDIDEIEDTVLEEWGMETLTTLVCYLQSAFFWVDHRTQVLQLKLAFLS